MKTKLSKIRLISDIESLLFPQECLSCDKELSRLEKYLCSFCKNDLPLTNFHLFKEPSPIDKLFWGRVQITATYSHLFFEKNKTSQALLFNLKYKNKPNIGVYFGKEMGEKLNMINTLCNVDAIIPVPLHFKKEFIRGYNQSEVIAEGICETFKKPIDITTVQRTKHSESQTKKSRFQRWDNVNEIFRIHHKINSYNHILLVDDVITTGSTLESIINAIREKNPNLLISVVTLAIA